MAILSAVVIPDTHRPYHHRRAFQLMLKITKALRPDEVVVLGDFADFYAVQMHGPRDPQLMHSLKDEADDVNKGLDEIEAAAPAAKKIYLEGNHEFRLERFLIANALPIYGIFTVRTLLKIDERKNWRWVAYEKNQKHEILGTQLLARHEPGSMSSPAASMKALMASHIYGHVHRREEANSVTLDNRPLIAHCPGWLGDSRLKPFDYMKKTPQWQLGFDVVYVDDDTKAFYIESVKIHEDAKGKVSAVFNGKLWTV